MKQHLFKNILWMAAVFAIGQTAWASSVIKYEKRQPALQHTEANSVLLQCFLSPNKVQRSRAVLLQMAGDDDVKSTHEVAVTTGHGLIDPYGNVFSNCEIMGPSGRTYPVRSIKLAPNYQPGTTTDWAVISFEKLHKESVQHYVVMSDINGGAAENLARRKIPVLFSKARGLPQNGQSCTLYPKKYAGFTEAHYDGFLAHNCRAIPGQSGTPVSVMSNGRPILVGIHIGHSFVLKVQGVERPPRFFGYMRIIDANMLEANINFLLEAEAQTTAAQTKR